jgi:hypothetical protein
MAIEKISNREQVLIFIVVATFVGGSYGLFRAVPELKKLAAAQETIVKNQDKVKNPVFPEEPNDDPEELAEVKAELEAELAGLRSNLKALEDNLAPTDNQEMLLKISEVARAAGVRVIESVPFIVQRKDGEATQANTKKISKRKQRMLARSARKNATKKGLAGTASASASIPKEGELIYRLVNELDNPRPFQRISVEGNFADLQKFLLSLRSLPWQATVVKLDVDVAIQTPPPGVPQPIRVSMIVAM